MKSAGIKTTYASLLKALNYDKTLSRQENMTDDDSSKIYVSYGNKLVERPRYKSAPQGDKASKVVSVTDSESYYSFSESVTLDVPDTAQDTAVGTVQVQVDVPKPIKDSETITAPEVVLDTDSDIGAETSFTPLAAIESIYRRITRELQNCDNKTYI